MMKNLSRIVLLVLAISAAAFAIPQEHAAPASDPKPAAAESAPAAENPNAKPEHELSQEASGANAAEGQHAKGEEGKEEGDEEGKLRQSAMVKKLGSMLGLSPAAAYWLFWTLNAGVLGMGVGYLIAAKLRPAMKQRTGDIQDKMQAGQKASAEAQARLSGIETRLSKIDTEVSGLRAQAAADFAAEEQRILKAAEEDARRVVEAAEQEIAAAAKAARRELKAFAAELAVGLAEKKIAVDNSTDERLVRSFTDNLGKDGK